MAKAVPLTLDRDRPLCFTFKALGAFKRKYGASLFDTLVQAGYGSPALAADAEAKARGSVAMLRASLDQDWVAHVLWAGMLHRFPRLTVDDVYEMVTTYMAAPDASMRSIIDAINAGFMEATQEIFGKTKEQVEATSRAASGEAEDETAETGSGDSEEGKERTQGSDPGIAG